MISITAISNFLLLIFDFSLCFAISKQNKNTERSRRAHQIDTDGQILHTKYTRNAQVMHTPYECLLYRLLNPFLEVLRNMNSQNNVDYVDSCKR